MIAGLAVVGVAAFGATACGEVCDEDEVSQNGQCVEYDDDREFEDDDEGDFGDEDDD